MNKYSIIFISEAMKECKNTKTNVIRYVVQYKANCPSFTARNNW